MHKGRALIRPKHGPFAISGEPSKNGLATGGASFLTTYFDWLLDLSSPMRRALASAGSFGSEAN